jgi:GTP cyclohydrolase I
MTAEIIRPKISPARPNRAEAEKAVETLLRYIGEDASRPGLLETPDRVVRSFDEFFAGYEMDAAAELEKTFEDIKDFNEIVLVKNIEFVSHCEHHILPITGVAHVAYWPDQKVVGLSKLARIVDIYAKRLSSQEKMTRQIVDVMEKSLTPKGVAVMIDADHQCMSIRGVNKPRSSTVTTTFTGIFEKDASVRERFMGMLKG